MTSESLIYRAAKTAVDGRIQLSEAEGLFRKALITAAMNETKKRSLHAERKKNGNKCEAAKILGIHRNTIIRDMKRFGTA